MNAELLLAHYERIAEAPDAIQRLRELVLDIAIQGKATNFKGPWRKTTLAELGAWGSGGTPSKSHPEYYGGDIPWLVIGDLNDGIVERSQNSITEAGLANSSAKLIAPGTVLIAMYGSIGKLGIAGIECATNQAIAYCIPSEEIVTRQYLFWLLRSLRNELLGRGQGIAQQNISQKILKAWPVQLPPLAEQHRIVAKVDELMTLCDQLETAQADREMGRDKLTLSTLAKLNAPDPETFADDASFALEHLESLTKRTDQIKQLRQTILNLAVRGKLVEQDPNDEPASELLASVAKKREQMIRAGEIRRDKQLNDIKDTEFPFQLPQGWAWSRLGSLIHLVSGQHLQPSEYTEGQSGDLPYITGPSDFGDQGLKISRFSLVRKAVAKRGQLLLTVKGSGVGKATTCDIPEVAISRQLMALTAIGWERRFLTLLTHRLAESLQESARSLIPGIAREDVEQFIVAVPPLAEQHRIVAKVDELMALCDQLEANLTEGEQARSKLLEAVLHEALEPA